MKKKFGNIIYILSGGRLPTIIKYIYLSQAMADLLQKMKKQMLRFNVMLIGQSGVGKSCIMIRYTRNEFSQSMNTTLGIDFLEKSFKYQNKSVRIQVWDTSGQQLYRSISVNRYKRSNCVVFVYDMTEQKSLKALYQYWIPTAVNECPEGTLFAVFGNKSDLVQDPERINSLKQEVDKKLKALSLQLKVSFINFVGNCKMQHDRGIDQMMNKITETIYNEREQKSRIREQQQFLQRQRSILSKPPQRKSIVLSKVDFGQKKKTQKKKCGIF